MIFSDSDSSLTIIADFLCSLPTMVGCRQGNFLENVLVFYKNQNVIYAYQLIQKGDNTFKIRYFNFPQCLNILYVKEVT